MYLAGQYEGIVKNDLYDLNPSGMGTRKVRIEDGIYYQSIDCRPRLNGNMQL